MHHTRCKQVHGWHEQVNGIFLIGKHILFVEFGFELSKLCLFEFLGIGFELCKRFEILGAWL